MYKIIGVVAALALLGAACTSDDETATATATGTGTPTAGECVIEGGTDETGTAVETALDDFTIAPSPDEVEAGVVTFSAENVGVEPHEVVIVRAATIEELPTDDQGAVDESLLEEGAFIGEIEAFASSETCEGSFEMAAGDYVLLCNIVETEEDGTIESHFVEGMATTFTVT